MNVPHISCDTPRLFHCHLCLDNNTNANSMPPPFEEYSCVVCSRPTGLSCGQCHRAWYCGMDHLREVCKSVPKLLRGLRQERRRTGQVTGKRAAHRLRLWTTSPWS